MAQLIPWLEVSRFGGAWAQLGLGWSWGLRVRVLGVCRLLCQTMSSSRLRHNAAHDDTGTGCIRCVASKSAPSLLASLPYYGIENSSEEIPGMRNLFPSSLPPPPSSYVWGWAGMERRRGSSHVHACVRTTSWFHQSFSLSLSLSFSFSFDFLPFTNPRIHASTRPSTRETE